MGKKWGVQDVETKRKRKLILGVVIVTVIVAVAMFAGCIEEPEITPTSTPMITPQRTIIVTSTADSGPGTLRQKLSEAQSGDKIIFDIAIFPSNAPNTIFLTNSLPEISQGNITIDASNAGVVLDGSNILEGEWTPGLEINSKRNTIQGLHIINFSGAGIVLNKQAQQNTIGGDRSIGSGPIGQGNLISGNSDGIGLFGASDNIIVGNLIGTDASATEAFGNEHPGIFLENDASYNVIGPGNIIAYNGDHGIDVRSSGSSGNTLTQNSIHDNARSGINLLGGGDATLLPPLIIDFDLDAGTLQGHTNCPNCKIEIFSDNNSEGEVYEGQTIADNNSVFNFNKGASFTKSHITATVTDNEGSTSQFSTHTSGVSRSIIFQEGNNLPKTQLEPKESRELVDNRIGSLWDGFWAVDMQQIVDTEILPIGLKRVRLAINGISWNTINWSKPELTIDPSDDEIVTRIADNGITITYVLTFWDKAQQAEGKPMPCPRFKTEKEIQRYLDFVQFIVHHFKDRVQYFEIWNEPDMGWGEGNMDPCVQAIEVEDYINLVKRAVPVIRQEYPDAKIVVGSTMPQVESGSREYLLSILSSDIMPLVDVVAWHPGGPSEEYEYWRENYYNYPFLVQEIKDVASANGFKGEYTADEMVWWTQEDFPSFEPWTYSDTVAAKYYARFIIMHLSMDVTVQPGGISRYREISFSTIQNLCTIMSGAKPTELSLEIESDATNIRNYTFSLSNGDELIALWTDGVAVDDDPGVKANLTFHGFTAQDVTGIDVLKDFQQPIITSNENGNLTIQNLIVRDYPLILHITKSSTQ